MKKLRCDIERFCRMRGDRGDVSTLQFVATCFNPRMAPVVMLRLSEFFYERRLGVLSKLFSMFNVVIFGIEVSPKVSIGGGLFLPHTVGTVLGAARIGDNCTIMQGVTLGANDTDLGFTESQRPVIGNHVLIGAGAKVIGGVDESASEVLLPDAIDNGAPGEWIFPFGEPLGEGLAASPFILWIGQRKT